MFKKSQSDFLFAQPSFLSGAARVLDMAGSFDRYNSSDDPDSLAIASDWYVIGGDLRAALEQEGVMDSLAEAR